MKLTSTQIKYAKERIDQVARKRIDTAIAALGAKPERSGFSFADQYKCIAAGKAKLKPLDKVSSYTDLNDAYTYPEREKEVAVHDKRMEVYDHAVENAEKKVLEQKTKLVDQLMLGVDADKVLSLIEKFAAGKLTSD